MPTHAPGGGSLPGPSGPPARPRIRAIRSKKSTRHAPICSYPTFPLLGFRFPLFVPLVSFSNRPARYHRIKVVTTFHELVSTPFGDGINALCWERTLAGDFDEVVERLAVIEGITTLDAGLLESLPVSAGGRTAIQTLLADQELLRSHGLAPTLDCIHAYPRDEDPGAVPTDVYSFHADSATVPTDTYLCSYNEASSEGLPNEQAQRRVDVPETRLQLLELFGGPDNDEFREFLRETCSDLHYAPIGEARPFSFGIGNLWRIAVEYPGSPVPPCVHRAPEFRPGRPARLLLIS